MKAFERTYETRTMSRTSRRFAHVPFARTFADGAAALAAFVCVTQLAQAQTCTTAAQSERLGGGSAGSVGVARIAFDGAPIVGRSFGLYVSDGLPLASGWFAASGASAPVVFAPLGITWHPANPLALLTAFTFDENGRSPQVFDGVVPTSFCGLEVVVQSIALDPAGPTGITAGDARRLRFGSIDGGALLQGETLSVGHAASRLVLADIDGDGHDDHFALTATTNSVAVSLGSGDGTFAAPLSSAANNQPSFVRIADMNGDGHLDAVTCGSTSAAVVVLLGRGDGTFDPPISVGVGATGTRAAVGDIDGDGVLDIATRRLSQSPSVQIHRGLGNGQFALFPTQPANPFAVDVALADANGDGFTDLLTCRSSGDFRVALGNGDGTFGSNKVVVGGSGLQTIVAADLDGDGHLDMLAGGQDSFFVVYGDGQGDFDDLTTVWLQRPATLVELEDVDGDGDLDVVSAGFGDNNVAITLNVGQRNFAAPQHYLGGQVLGMDVSDVDEDGLLDVVVGGQWISVLRGLGQGRFDGPRLYLSTTGSVELDVGDLDRDGTDDLVCTTTINVATVLRNTGDGEFALPSNYAASQIFNLADIDGDGVLDGYGTFGSVTQWARGLGSGGFAAPSTIASDPDLSAFGTIAADFDADGDLDIAVLDVTPNRLRLLVNSGNGSFAGTAVLTPLPSAPFDTMRAVGHLDGDPYPDLVLSLASPSRLVVMTGSSSGVFTPHPTTYAIGGNSRHAVLHDMNGDGRLDSVRAEITGVGLEVRLGNGDGTFAGPTTTALGTTVFEFAVADFDGDRVLDVALPGPTGTRLALHRGVGDGTFLAPLFFTGIDTWRAAAVADFDGDGLPDLATAFDGDIAIHFGSLLR